MEIINIKCSESEIRKEAIEHLAGKIFHVTTCAGFKSILESGYIHPTGHFLTTPQWNGSKDSFFGSMGCVSVCDLLNNSSEMVEKALRKYYYIDPLHSKKPVYLILNHSISKNLISWIEWENQGATSQVVPGLEAGFKGSIKVSAITTAVCVNHS